MTSEWAPGPKVDGMTQLPAPGLLERGQMKETVRVVVAAAAGSDPGRLLTGAPRLLGPPGRGLFGAEGVLDKSRDK